MSVIVYSSNMAVFVIVYTLAAQNCPDRITVRMVNSQIKN